MDRVTWSFRCGKYAYSGWLFLREQFELLRGEWTKKPRQTRLAIRFGSAVVLLILLVAFRSWQNRGVEIIGDAIHFRYTTGEMTTTYDWWAQQESKKIAAQVYRISRRFPKQDWVIIDVIYGGEGTLRSKDGRVVNSGDHFGEIRSAGLVTFRDFDIDGYHDERAYVYRTAPEFARQMIGGTRWKGDYQTSIYPVDNNW